MLNLNLVRCHTVRKRTYYPGKFAKPRVEITRAGERGEITASRQPLRNFYSTSDGTQGTKCAYSITRVALCSIQASSRVGTPGIVVAISTRE